MPVYAHCVVVVKGRIDVMYICMYCTYSYLYLNGPILFFSNLRLRMYKHDCIVSVSRFTGILTESNFSYSYNPCQGFQQGSSWNVHVSYSMFAYRVTDSDEFIIWYIV